MRKTLFITLSVLLISMSSFSQITIGTADLPHENDTFRVSIAQPLPGIDLTITGANQTWDFTALIPASQRVDSFVDEASTNPVFAVVFINLFINANRSNQASPGGNFNLGTSISLTDVYNFYYNFTDFYKQVGIGAVVNGLPVPVTFSPHDIEYRFPLQFNNSDSSASGYTVDMTSTLGFYYKVDKNRLNHVDGWGLLHTPYGSYNTLRVHSVVTQQDSVHLDTLGNGFSFPPVTTHEYKWLAPGEGIPVLQINATAGGVITQIIYKDMRRSLAGIESIASGPANATLYPNPASDDCTIGFEMYKAGIAAYEIFSMDGKILISSTETFLPAGKHEFKIALEKEKFSEGNYLVRLKTNADYSIQKLNIVKK